MKKTAIVLSVIMLSLITFNSCRETKEKETIIIEKETEEQKGILEKAGEKVDKEVNEEIDKAIDDIGDDN